MSESHFTSESKHKNKQRFGCFFMYRATPTTYLNIFADQVQPFMTMAFPGGSGLFQQQDNATCHTAHKCSGQIPHIVKKWFTL